MFISHLIIIFGLLVANVSSKHSRKRTNLWKAFISLPSQLLFHWLHSKVHFLVAVAQTLVFADISLFWMPILNAWFAFIVKKKNKTVLSLSLPFTPITFSTVYLTVCLFEKINTWDPEWKKREHFPFMYEILNSGFLSLTLWAITAIFFTVPKREKGRLGQKEKELL